MGAQDVDREADAAQLRVFIGRLLRDLRALEQMLGDGLIESGVRRIGAEQELCLVDRSWRPALLAMEILAACDDPRYTTELGRFNLEINLDPLDFAGDCLGRMERELETLLAHLRTVASRHGAEVVLTGILPTIRKSDLALANMTPRPRYIALSRALDLLRGGPYEFQLKGPDELIVKHESMMLEACCTSFQVHYQVDPDRFALLYNLAQAVTAPLLAAATNSPLLFGRRLWRETRIPLFQQAVDTRSASHHMRERSPRVSFGRQWVQDSVLGLFQEDLARFRVLLGAPLHEDSVSLLKRGILPRLEALRLHNGTVYRWNRACIGIDGDRAHLRIENRVLPSGPTVLDEVANAAFFLGLMSGGLGVYGDVTRRMAFHDAEHNFLAAAQVGLDAQFTWMDARVIPARELICSELLPVARQGLQEAGILASDIERYLGVVSERVASGRTGSQWLLQSLAAMEGEDTRDALLSALTAATATRQWEGMPVHEWPMARLGEGSNAAGRHDLRIEEFMTTDLCTVHPDEPVELAANLMDWKHIRHIPVENEQDVLVGVVSCFEMFRYFARDHGDATEPAAVGSIMTRNPKTVVPETLVLDAVALMRREGMDCLLVVKEDRLVGIVTERDILNITTRLLTNEVRQSPPEAG